MLLRCFCLCFKCLKFLHKKKKKKTVLITSITILRIYSFCTHPFLLTYFLYTISEYAFSLHVVLKFSFEKNYPGVNVTDYIKFTLLS